MGPRKEAKDSRKICERGVPGNFYLAQPPYESIGFQFFSVNFRVRSSKNLQDYTTQFHGDSNEIIIRHYKDPY